MYNKKKKKLLLPRFKSVIKIDSNDTIHPLQKKTNGKMIRRKLFPQKKFFFRNFKTPSLNLHKIFSTATFKLKPYYLYHYRNKYCFVVKHSELIGNIVS